MLLFCAKTIVKESCEFERPSEEEERTFWPSGDFLVWYFRDAFSPLGVLFVMKTLEDER